MVDRSEFSQRCSSLNEIVPFDSSNAPPYLHSGYSLGIETIYQAAEVRSDSNGCVDFVIDTLDLHPKADFMDYEFRRLVGVDINYSARHIISHDVGHVAHTDIDYVAMCEDCEPLDLSNGLCSLVNARDYLQLRCLSESGSWYRSGLQMSRGDPALRWFPVLSRPTKLEFRVAGCDLNPSSLFGYIEIMAMYQTLRDSPTGLEICFSPRA